MLCPFFSFRKCKCGPGKTPNHEVQESFEIHEESDIIEDKRGNTRIRNDKNQRNTNESEESFVQKTKPNSPNFICNE